jgi:WD40 repeat protein
MFCPPLRRPGRSDTDVTLLGLIVVLLLLLLAGGGGFVFWHLRQAQAARMEALAMEEQAREQAEIARAEADEARAVMEKARRKEDPRVQDLLRAGQPHPAAPLLEEGLKACAKGQVNEGLLWFARGLEQSGNDANQQRLFRANLAAWGQPQPPPRPVFQEMRGGALTALAVSPDGKTAVSGSENGFARAWRIDGWKSVGDGPAGEGKVGAVGFGAGGKEWFVATGAEVRPVEAATGKPVGEGSEAPGDVLAMGLTADGKVMMCGTCGQGVWLSEGGERQGATKLFSPESPVLAVALGPDAELVVTGHEDHTARLWGADRKPLGSPLAHDGPVRAVAVSADGTLLATATGKAVRLWDAATRRPIGPAQVHEADVLSLAFSPDGKALLTGDAAGAARLVTVPAPLGEDVRRLKLWAEVTARAELDAAGKMRLLDEATLLQRRQGLQALGGPPKQ